MDIPAAKSTGSPPVGKHFSYVLDSSLNNLLYTPKGFVHGFITMQLTIFHYKYTNLCHKKSDSGIIWNDKTQNIDWKIKTPNISEKDQTLPTFQEFLNNIEQ